VKGRKDSVPEFGGSVHIQAYFYKSIVNLQSTDHMDTYSENGSSLSSFKTYVFFITESIYCAHNSQFKRDNQIYMR